MVRRFGWISPLSGGLVWSQSLRIVGWSFMYFTLLAACSLFRELEPAKHTQSPKTKNIQTDLSTW